jgi:hypothetical protein
MTFTFRPAIRENVQLLIGVAGGTGSGKTFSAMRLASGMSGGKPFVVIDTENGRARHYADAFKFDCGDLRAPFRPNAYAEAIIAADAAGYPVIVVDSFSHEHAGEGGILDMQEAELNRLAGDDWKKREAVKMLSWAACKKEHKHMMQKLLQVKANVILCFRAEEKIEVAKVDGKTVVRPKQSLVGLDGWIPVCEKTVPFEMTCSFLLTPDAPGIPKPIKLQQQHRPFIRLDSPLDENAGARLQEWAAGGIKVSVSKENAPNGQEEATASALIDFLSMIDGASSMEELKEFFAAAVDWAKINDRTAIPKLTEAKDKRKSQL